jgi:hypothetical protein
MAPGPDLLSIGDKMTNIKRRIILLVTLFLTCRIAGAQQFPCWYVSITMPEGPAKEGYILETANSFEEFVKTAPTVYQGRAVTLYPKVYSVNDEGHLGGQVACLEDGIPIDPAQFKNSTEIKEPGGKPVRYCLSKHQIKIMQKELVGTDYGLDGPCEYELFNFNAQVTSDVLNHYAKTLDQAGWGPRAKSRHKKVHGDWSRQKFNDYLAELENKNIVAVELGCSD